jgi:non-canonical purine NTP pyrophosphatase (RdgB/HAM1 family)
MKEIIIVTGNEKKWNEIKTILHEKLNNIKLIRKNLEIKEIQGSEEEIIKHKALTAYKKFKKPCVVEDVSFGFEEWNYLPGPYIKQFIKDIGSGNFHKLLKNKKARAKCTFAFIKSEKEIKIVEGIVNGKIVKPKIDNAFGFDKVFVPEKYNKTFSEMDINEKNKISHRSIALNKLIKILKDYKL